MPSATRPGPPSWCALEVLTCRSFASTVWYFKNDVIGARLSIDSWYLCIPAESRFSSFVGDTPIVGNCASWFPQYSSATMPPPPPPSLFRRNHNAKILSLIPRGYSHHSVLRANTTCVLVRNSTCVYSLSPSLLTAFTSNCVTSNARMLLSARCCCATRS